MKRLTFILWAFFLISGLLFTGCTKDKETDKYELLLDHLKSEGLNVGSMHTDGWAVSAKALNDNINDYYIVDIRSAQAYNAGHIKGAVNTTLTKIIEEGPKAGTKKIIIVSEDGQDAAFALAALRLSGYPNTHFLKWGISAWNSTLDKWTANIANIAIEPSQHANWVTYSATSFKENKNFDKTPEVKSASDDAATVLKERIVEVLKGGPKYVNPTDALNKPGDYFINNYWSVDNVSKNGNAHLKGAYRILPLSIATDDLRFLNPDQKIVTYCFTGQTSSAVTFYLRVLGYEAYGIKYGVNAYANKQMTSNKWPEGQQNYELEK
jgi:rhodanese-related sulfurtransferase